MSEKSNVLTSFLEPSIEPPIIPPIGKPKIILPRTLSKILLRSNSLIKVVNPKTTANPIPAPISKPFGELDPASKTQTF